VNMETAIDNNSGAPIRKKLVIKVFGIGGAGCNVLGFAADAPP
jgi:cell division GTPase FtsZ